MRTEREKSVKSNGEVTGTVIRWGKEHYYLEAVHPLPARPSSRSSMKMKMYEQDGAKIYIYYIDLYKHAVIISQKTQRACIINNSR
jgi:hypothetical protein